MVMGLVLGSSQVLRNSGFYPELYALPGGT